MYTYFLSWGAVNKEVVIRDVAWTRTGTHDVPW
jgi:hypothetical protein